MANINRDYLVVIDVKSGNINKPSMVFYNTDKNTSNIYAQLVVKETIVHATPIENATDFVVELKVIKPENIVKMMTGVLVNEAEAIYEFDLPVDFINVDGTYAIEFWVKAKVADREEIITSSRGKYTVKASILTDLDEAIEDHDDYPLFLKLMEEVRVINETAHELDTTIRTLQADMIVANNEMKANEEQRQANEVLRETNEATRVAQENARQEYLNAFDGKWEEYKADTDADIADYKAQINAQEVIRETNEEQRKANEQRRITNEDERKVAENQRKANEFERRTNEAERKSAEASRVSAENTRVANEEIRQTNEANREAAEAIRKANEEARIAEHEAMRTEHEQTMTAVNEVKAENAVLMENDKKVSDRMTQVEISDKRQYVIMEGLMNSAGDGYLKIEDTGNDTTLYNSVEGFVDVKNIIGNTMVNSIKNPDDELTLNGDINTSGQSVTLTTAVDNGQVDVLAEGNTMVNVCDQQEAVAITKSYTVETGNHVALQGEFDGKARPVPTGNTMVNVANSNWSQVGSAIINYETIDNGRKIITSTSGSAVMVKKTTILKDNTDYTFVFDINTDFPSVQYSFTDDTTFTIGSGGITDSSDYSNGFSRVIVKRTTTTGCTGIVFGYHGSVEADKILQIKNLVVLEGDYTNKPIPDYFSGMKSSFEDKIVTQEMVDSGQELAENLGKYRVDYKVTGKNKISVSETGKLVTIGSGGAQRYGFEFNKKGTFALSLTNANNYNLAYKVKSGSNYSSYTAFTNNITFTLNKDETLLVYVGNENTTLSDFGISNIQIEEGSTATAYEPYKESIKTYYLNSPLLEGDTIEESNGNVYHVHRYKELTINTSTLGTPSVYQMSSTNYVGCGYNTSLSPTTDGVRYGDNTISNCIFNRAYNNDNDFYVGGSLGIIVNNKNKLAFKMPVSDTIVDYTSVDNYVKSLGTIEIVYQLASPTKELISQSDTILTDSYVAGHLDFDTVVPVERVVFNRAILRSLKYLYPNTEYTIQFESDNVGILKNAYIGSDMKQNALLNVVKGVNKFNFTLTSTQADTYPYFSFDGIGFSASNIVVTEATDKDFGYFSGMKSVGELEENKIEILSTNSNLLDNSIYILNGALPVMTIGTVYNDNNRPTHSNGRAIVHFPCKPNTTYYLTAKGTLDRTNYVGTLNKDKVWVALVSDLKYSFSNNVAQITTTSDSYYLEWYLGQNADNLVHDVILSEIPITRDEVYKEAQSNKKQILLNEPLRAVGDTKDRFVQIDGKWYVERRTVGLNGLHRDTSVAKFKFPEKSADLYCVGQNLLSPHSSSFVPIKSDKLKCILNNFTDPSFTSDHNVYMTAEGSIWVSFPSNTDTATVDNFLSDCNIVYKSTSPTYEPVEISPVLNTYTDVTHISNNSTIPMNIPVVNSGYEIIAKPSTKYTVVGIDSGRIGDSTIVNGTITTPATLDDPFLRPYGTGKTSKVMLLEGEPANIPGYFKGIKSVFEDKVTEDGKYAVEVKVVGKNKCNNDNNILGNLDINTGNFHGSSECIVSDFIKVFEPYVCSCVSDKIVNPVLTYRYYDINKKYLGTNKPSFYPHYVRIRCLVGFTISKDYISFQIEEGTVASEYEPYHETKQTLYLDEPLYNTNNITIYNDKLGYWKNCNKVVLNGSEYYGTWENPNKKPTQCVFVLNESSTVFPNMARTGVNNYQAVYYTMNDFCKSDVSKTGYVSQFYNDMHFGIPKGALNTPDVDGFKQYLSENPVTVVYQLKEPIFVPLIDNCPNWVIGSWDNCSIHFDSIIPLKDTRYRYTGNVPSVVAMSDDVAETKSISDEQDAMIVDLATDVAVMEMMLM